MCFTISGDYMGVKDVDLAWAAGFFDGEGHCRGKFSKTVGLRAELQVGQKLIDCLERLKSIFGVGTIGGPYHKENPVYFWYVTKSSQVDEVLTKLWPYLSSPKRIQAEKAGFILGIIRNPKQGRPPNKLRTKPECHPNRIHVAFGKCAKCYHHDKNKEQNGK